jgi:hypothetical protein
LNIIKIFYLSEITILLDAKCSKNETNFYLSYVILNASWGPKYDIRVFSNKKDMIVSWHFKSNLNCFKYKKHLKINYYGLIQQSTGEDWNDTKISLSTALPSIGGNVPKLGTMSVGIKQIYNPG